MAGGTRHLTITICECCWGARQSHVPHTEAMATVISAQRTELVTIPCWSLHRAACHWPESTSWGPRSLVSEQHVEERTARDHTDGAQPFWT